MCTAADEIPVSYTHLDVYKRQEQELASFAAKLDSMTIKTLLSGEYDRNNAILKLNAGQVHIHQQELFPIKRGLRNYSF